LTLCRIFRYNTKVFLNKEAGDIVPFTKRTCENEKNVSAEQRQKKKENRLYGKNVDLGRKKSFERAQKKRPQNLKRVSGK